MIITEEVLKEIQDAITLNKTAKKKSNTALTNAMSLIMRETKELQNRLDKEYKRGMNDAWEIARVVINMEDKEFDNIFDKNLSARYVITNSNPFRVKEKISAYHKAQEDELNKIHVGDVVQHIADATKAIILDNDSNTNLGMKKWMVFTENGCVESWYEDDFTKTGESVDVCSALIK